MIRWREMLMDYGQMYGDEGKGGAGGSMSGSSFFTVDGDLMAKRDADLELRRTLETHFRPLFQRFVYGGEKIACHDLRRVLQDPEYRNRLPPDKVHELVDVADFNTGRSIKYEEFVRIVMGRTHEEVMSEFGSVDPELPAESRLAAPLRVVCRNTAQQDLVNQHVSKYKCIPPAFFMVLVTLVQVVVFVVYSFDDDVSTKALEGVPQNNSLMYMPTRRREAWRFMSYCLLHQGVVDLFCNVLIQILIGVPLEIIFSWGRVAIVYTVGVIMGSLAQSVADHDAGLVGAAGGAYAILAGHMLAMFTNRKRLNLNVAENQATRVLCSLTLRFILILLVVIPQVGLAIYRRWFLDDIPMKIGIAAHVTGLGVGLTMSSTFLQQPGLNPITRGAGLFDFFLLLAVVGGSVIFNILYKDFPEEDYRSLSDFLDGKS